MDGEEVSGVVGTAHGALLVTDRGVSALAVEQWPEQRDGQSGERGHSLVMLEARTGVLEREVRLGDGLGSQDEIHLEGLWLLHRLGSELSSYALKEADKIEPMTDETSWTMTEDDFCPGAGADEEAQVTESHKGFIISARCTGEGQDTHLVTHLNGQNAEELWRFDWDGVEPGSPFPNILFMGAGIIPDSPEDIVPGLLDKDRTTTYAVAWGLNLSTPAKYTELTLFQLWDADGISPRPFRARRNFPKPCFLVTWRRM